MPDMDSAFDFSTLFGTGAAPVDPGAVAPAGQGGLDQSQLDRSRQPVGTGGNPLLSIIGMEPNATAAGNRMARASLGAGLTSVSQNWNKPALAALAGGAGAALQGGDAAQAQQDQQDLNRQKAFADILNKNLELAIKARAEGDMATWREATTAIQQAHLDMQRAAMDRQARAAAGAGLPDPGAVPLAAPGGAPAVAPPHGPRPLNAGPGTAPPTAGVVPPPSSPPGAPPLGRPARVGAPITAAPATAMPQINMPQIKEGATATNPRTGERLIFQGGRWISTKGAI